jgi:hypothetical protein
VQNFSATNSAAVMAPPSSDSGLAQARVEVSLRATIPYAQYEYVDVSFNATEDTDTDIRHGLQPPDPEDVDFQVVRVNAAATPTQAYMVYRDTSATRRPWGTGYVVLRANEAALSVTLLLTVRPRRSLA